jgi:hypothetical protein
MRLRRRRRTDADKTIRTVELATLHRAAQPSRIPLVTASDLSLSPGNRCAALFHFIRWRELTPRIDSIEFNGKIIRLLRSVCCGTVPAFDGWDEN